MSLFLSLLPIYLLGNLHCAGMCGPLVMLLSQHPYSKLYFLGRLISFSLTALIASEVGMLFFLFLAKFHISSLIVFIGGLCIILVALATLFKLSLPRAPIIAKVLGPLSLKLTHLLANPSPFAPFLFGLGTVLLPCGQTLIVFSACALEGSALIGLLNGFCFAALTSPSLIAALYTSKKLNRKKSIYQLGIGLTTLVIGLLAVLRGCADFEWIPHYTLNKKADPKYHIVFF